MKKIIVSFFRFLRIFNNPKISFGWKEESIGAPGLFCVSEKVDRLYSEEDRQLRIALRKKGYRGNLDLRSMNKFLGRTKQKPMFISYYCGSLVCELEFVPCYENMALYV